MPPQKFIFLTNALCFYFEPDFPCPLLTRTSCPGAVPLPHWLSAPPQLAPPVSHQFHLSPFELSLWASVCRGQLMVLCLLLFNRFTWISSITSPSGIMCFWSYTTETTCFLYFVPVPCHWLLLWRQTSRATERDSGSIVCFITHTPVCYTSSNRKPKGVWKKPFGIAMTHCSPGLKNNLSLSRAHPGVQPHVSGMYLWSDFCACGTVPTNAQNK